MTNRRHYQESIATDYSLSESIYSYGYDLRLKYSSFAQDTLDWMESHSSELLPTERPDILSLGCGTGKFDSRFIKRVGQKRTAWTFTGLDFSATDLARFQKRLATLDQETRRRIALKFRKFDAATDLGVSYDLITMIHFLHSFDDLLPMIKNALNHLSPGGRLFIIQQNRPGISRIKDQFQDILPNQKFHCSEHVKKLLRSEQIEFTAEEIETVFDVSIMREMSLETLLLMSFCLVNDLSLLEPYQQERIRQTFLSSASEQNDGTAVIHESMEAIVCHV